MERHEIQNMEISESLRAMIARTVLKALVQREGIRSLDDVCKHIVADTEDMDLMEGQIATFTDWLREEMLKGVRSRPVVDPFYDAAEGPAGG